LIHGFYFKSLKIRPLNTANDATIKAVNWLAKVEDTEKAAGTIASEVVIAEHGNSTLAVCTVSTPRQHWNFVSSTTQQCF
jgi:hypothetical protein